MRIVSSNAILKWPYKRLKTLPLLSFNQSLVLIVILYMTDLCFHLELSTSSRSWQKLDYNPFKYIRNLQWFHIPVSLGLAFIAFQQYRHIRKRQHSKNVQNGDVKPFVASDFEISVYKMLPLRALSRCWGWINSVYLPVFMRSSILSVYIRTFGCDLNEASIEDLKQYKNLGEFFRRTLKPGLRPISNDIGVVSPADGTVVYFGRAEKGKLEQVKGVNYSLSAFMGPQTWNVSNNIKSDHENSGDEYQRNLLRNDKNTELYHCVIYLAPGDYHRFHSPVEWTIAFRRHFPGQLLSVRPKFINWFPGLFNINERVIYTGEWPYGFFSMAAVGATNVGSVRVYFDNGLVTNERYSKRTFGSFKDLCLNDVTLRKGDAFGEFNLGSTVVLIFEGPKNMQFDVKMGEKVKYGQLLCAIKDQNTK